MFVTVIEWSWSDRGCCDYLDGGNIVEVYGPFKTPQEASTAGEYGVLRQERLNPPQNHHYYEEGFSWTVMRLKPWW